MQYTGRQRSTYHLLVNINVIYTICTVHDTFSRATNRIDEKQKSDVSETSQHDRACNIRISLRAGYCAGGGGCWNMSEYLNRGRRPGGSRSRGFSEWTVFM